MIKYLLFLGVLIPVTVLAQIDNNRGIIIKAETKKNSGTTYAIVIGISKYKEVPTLQFADRDAAVFADYLLNSKGMALDSSHVKVFLNEICPSGVFTHINSNLKSCWRETRC